MKLCDQKGLAIVELALLLPLLLLIVFGITEFGRALLIKNALTNAAREGARRASISLADPTTDPARTDLQKYVSSACPFTIDPAAVVIESTPSPPQHGVSTIKVTVPYTFDCLYDEIPLDMTLKGQASMFYE